jgi:hypothetical protein
MVGLGPGSDSLLQPEIAPNGGLTRDSANTAQAEAKTCTRRNGSNGRQRKGAKDFGFLHSITGSVFVEAGGTGSRVKSPVTPRP